MSSKSSQKVKKWVIVGQMYLYSTFQDKQHNDSKSTFTKWWTHDPGEIGWVDKEKEEEEEGRHVPKD